MIGYYPYFNYKMMKNLFKVMFFASLMLTATTFTSCSSDDGENEHTAQVEESANLEAMKTSIAECNDALNENFNSSNFTSFNKVLNRLLNLSLFDDDNLQKIHQRANARMASTLLVFDEIDLDMVDDEYLYNIIVSAKALGYKYLVSFRFDHLHFSYNTATDDWDVDDEYDGGVLIEFPDEDGTPCTVEFTNKSDYFEYPEELIMPQVLTPSSNSTVLILEMCELYDVVAKRGNETVLTGDAKNWAVDAEEKCYSDVNLHFGDFDVAYDLKDHQDEAYYDIDIVVSKNGKDLISLDMSHSYAQYDELIYPRTSTWNFFDKIRIEGEHSDAIQESQLMIAAAKATDESTINSYLSQLNEMQKLTVYYGPGMTKTANMKWGSGKIQSDKYDVIPLVQLEEDGDYTSIIHELRLGDISGVLTFISSFDSNVVTSLLNLFSRQDKWISAQQ